MKKYILFLISMGIVVQVKAGSITYGGIPSVLQDISIATLTVSNNATFNVQSGSVTILGATLQIANNLILKGKTSAGAAQSTGLNLYDSSNNTVWNYASGGFYLRNEAGNDLMSFGPRASNAREIGINDTTPTGLLNVVSTATNAAAPIIRAEDNSGNLVFEARQDASIGIGPANDCRTNTPITIGSLCQDRTLDGPVSVATGTNAGQYAKLLIEGATTYKLKNSTISTNGTLTISTGTTGFQTISISTHGKVEMGKLYNTAWGVMQADIPGNGIIATFAGGGDSRHLDFRDNSGVGLVLDTRDGNTLAFNVGGTEAARVTTVSGQPRFAPAQATSCPSSTPNAVGELCTQNVTACPILIATGTSAGNWACISVTGKQ